jgi:SPOR domain/Pilus formation protein N terminal region
MSRIAAFAGIALLASSAYGGSFTAHIGETAIVEIAGTTAAYAVDPSIADVTTAGRGRISVTGRSAGTTQVIAVTVAGTQSFLITIATADPVRVPSAVVAGRPIARAESRYSSSAAQVQNSVDVFTTNGSSTSQFHVLNVHYTKQMIGRASDAFPSVFYRISSPGRTLTLLDDVVDLSPITVRSTQVRGIHFINGPLELHAGYAASTLFDDLFLPADRRWLADAGYAFDAGGIRLIPSAHVFLSEPAGTAARRGAIGALAVERRTDALFARGEVAMSSNSLTAVAGEVRYETAREHLRFRSSYKPDDFPTLALADVPGVHADMDWMRHQTDRLLFDSFGTYERIRVGNVEETIGVSNIGARYTLWSHLTLIGGAEASIIKGQSSSIRTIGIPAGVSFDTRSWGAGATYRYINTTASKRPGDTIGVNAHAGTGVFRFSAWAERQRRAPTLDVIFREDPALELALLRLGISVRTPEDLARVLRDNAALINLGFIEGVTVNLSPRRREAGMDLGIVSHDMRDQLHLHGVADRVENVGATMDAFIATLTYTHRFGTATDIYGSYSSWRRGLVAHAVTGTAFEIGVRQRFDGMPRFLQRGGTINGVVFLDPEMRGVRGSGTTAVADIGLMLDGTRSVHTDRNGAYEFRNVAAGAHRIAVELSAERTAFFTTPSHAYVDAGSSHDFGFVWSPARIDGRVTSDAHTGIAGTVISLEAPSGARITATTDSDGEFAVAVPAGSYGASLSPETLPPGYALRTDTKRDVTAIVDQPQTLTFEVLALRSVAGKAAPRAQVRIEPLGRTATADASGRYVFRSLPAGSFTITDGRISRAVVATPEPMTLTDVNLMRDVVVQHGVAKSEPATSSVAAPLTSVEGNFRVQVGAYRDIRNARDMARQVERLGYHAENAQSGMLIIVSVGPFASQSEARRTTERLREAGVDSVVTSK